MEYEFTLPPTSDHLQAMGMVIAESAVLENILELAIWQLEGLPPEVGMHETLHLGFRHKSIRFFEAAKQSFTSESDRKTLATLMKDLRLVGRQRGLIVHGSWAWGIKQDTPWLAKFRRKKYRLIGEAQLTKAENIRDIAGNISRAGDNLIGFLQAHGVEPPPSKNL